MAYFVKCAVHLRTQALTSYASGVKRQPGEILQGVPEEGDGLTKLLLLDIRKVLQM